MTYVESLEAILDVMRKQLPGVSLRVGGSARRLAERIAERMVEIDAGLQRRFDELSERHAMVFNALTADECRACDGTGESMGILGSCPRCEGTGKR